MNTKTFSILALLALFLACGLTVKSAWATSQDKEKEESKLAQAMEQLEDGFRALRKSVGEADQQAASLTTVVAMQNAIGLAKLETPAMAATLAAEKRPEFVVAFRKEMLVLTRHLIDLEELLLDQKFDDAKTLLKKAKSMEDPGHERFTDEG